MLRWSDSIPKPFPTAVCLVVFPFLLFLGACASTNLIESPKTAYVPETGEPKEPDIIWTSRAFSRPFDYLGVVKTRSWSYDGALGRLVDGGKQLRADAVIDVHYEPMGFLNTMEAFAIKFK